MIMPGTAAATARTIGTSPTRANAPAVTIEVMLPVSSSSSTGW